VGVSLRGVVVDVLHVEVFTYSIEMKWFCFIEMNCVCFKCRI